jgi:hypothetical protein
VVLAKEYNADLPGFVKVKWNDDLRKIVKYLEENLEASMDKMLDV